MKPQTKQTKVLAGLNAEHHPYCSNIRIAIGSAARGEIVARRRYQNPKPYMNKARTLWKVTIAEYVRSLDSDERRQRKELTLGSTATMTKREAKRILQPILDRVNAQAFNPTVERKNTTFDAFADVWETDYLSQAKPSTRASMRGHVKRLKLFFGPKEIRSIETADVQRFVTKLTAEEYEPKTIRNFWITLRLILNAATIQGYADSVPHKPKLPKVYRKKARCFTDDEVAKILDATVELEPYALFRLAAETGVRAGEADGLTIHDLGDNRITVRQTVWNGIVNDDPKTENANRTIAISNIAWNCLCSRKNKQTEAGSVRLFARSTAYYRKYHLQPLLKQLGIKPGGFHAFRHFNASLMDRLRIPLKTRQVRLGHASTGSLTLDVYTHDEWEENEAAAEQISGAIEYTTWKVESFVSLTTVQQKGPAGGVRQAQSIQQENGCGGQI